MTNAVALPEINAVRRRHINWKQQGTAFLFLLPALLIFGLVTWYPIIQTVIISFQNVNLQGFQGWAGFSNYSRMFGDPLFSIVWQNTFNYVLISLLLGAMVPIILALMINEARGMSSFFQMLVYLPALIPSVVALIVWRQIYAPEGGILNSLLRLVAIHPQLWLQNPALAKPAIVIIMTWVGAGGTTLIYISALREIPPEIFEAAELDGFSPLQRVFYIALPLIASRIQIMVVLQVILVAQVFTEPFILTSGGPANSTRSPVLQIYNTAFINSDFGLASAWSVSMLVILAAFSIIYVWTWSRRNTSQG